MSLKQLEPPKCEPVSLVGMKAFLRIEHENEDDLINQMITTGRLAVEAFLLRSLIKQVWLYTFNSGYAGSLADEQYHQGERSRGEKGIELPRSPFIELADKIEKVDSFGRREIRDYSLDTAGRVARVHFGSSISSFLDGRGTIEIKFSAGYGEEPEDVPAPLRQAIMILVAELYEKRSSHNDNRFIPAPMNDQVIQLLKPYRVLRLA